MSTLPQPPLFPWYALKVRTAGESRVSTALQRKNLEVFLPTYLEVRKYSDRLKKVNSALFPGYLFARFDPQHRLPVLTTAGVESIVTTNGEPTSIDESEIDAIRRVIDSGASAIPWPYLKTGDRVTIAYGSMAGVEGILLKVRGEHRLILSVNLLQRSISVEIDRTWIRPAAYR